jgi:signal transduction histidine kinase
MHIVHNLVNGPLEGQIIIKSKPKQGTTFVLTIPKQLFKQPDDVAI